MPGLSANRKLRGSFAIASFGGNTGPGVRRGSLFGSYDSGLLSQRGAGAEFVPGENALINLNMQFALVVAIMRGQA